MFTIENLRKESQNSDGTSEILHALNVQIDNGETIAITGNQQSGRKSFLKIISFSERPDGGKIIFKHQNISNYTLLDLIDFRRNSVGFLSCESSLIKELTVLENIKLTLKSHNKSDNEEVDLINKTLDCLRIHDLIDKYPLQLSVVQQRFVQLACAIVHHPELLIIDEIEHLFGHQNLEILNILNHLNYSGITIIVGTNSEIYAHNNQRIIRLSEGYLVDDEVIIEVSVV